MRNPMGGRTILVGLAGVVLGGLAEALINRWAGTVVISDGMIWGAVLAIVALSVGNFGQMGHLAVKSDKPAVNVIVGLGLFAIISVVIITFFYLILLVFGRLML